MHRLPASVGLDQRHLAHPCTQRPGIGVSPKARWPSRRTVPRALSVAAAFPLQMLGGPSLLQYEEAPHYQTLRRVLVGDGEAMGGAVGRLAANILRRSAVPVSRRDFTRSEFVEASQATLAMRAVGDYWEPQLSSKALGLGPYSSTPRILRRRFVYCRR